EFSVTPLWQAQAEALLDVMRDHAPSVEEALIALGGNTSGSQQPGTDGEGRPYRIASVSNRQYSATDFFWPVRGSISSGYGMRRHPITRRSSFHAGIDIRSRTGTPILSPSDGVVISSRRAGAMGREVRVQCGGMLLVFGHLSAFRCKPGQRVRAGQVLGLVGASGRTTGPHLHFSVKRDGRWINPLSCLTPRRLASR
ncbi:MAG TPA: M23 family metallopeptidase, partial [Candidatus Ozemobacteraceae bacterium]|nr:M23 family metallopeptidase [Candidatus Ozemobacteraceae bacterium]